ncbi:VOC family protein [Atopomonas sediminilitoris]|uniref:VOC family protein n=1 Tax=Atopomonas sediminilitoris TaxID=2919919 RepID=UPI001F4EE28F|nr:VOC family protein [Atopomonas sediminilitoris]MCJ8169751.1 VOC family protein [Atopomonas sediminilitoris]
MERLHILRVARPTDHLDQVVAMYCQGLGYQVLASFADHHGFDGAILGLKSHSVHLEFTHCHGHRVGKAPTQDNLLVFYLPDEAEWQARCAAMAAAGFTPVTSFNPYWDVQGKTFEDVDGYRVVIQCEVWQDV